MTLRDWPPAACVGRDCRPRSASQQETGPSARRIAAAIVFPISWSDMQILAATVLKPQLETHAV